MEQYIRICSKPEAGEKSLLQLYRAMFTEINGTPRSQRQMSLANGLLTNIDIIELGYKEGLKRGIERGQKKGLRP